MKQFAQSLRPAAALVVLGALGCGGDLSLPSSSAAGLAVAVVQGNEQTGTVGQALPDPVVVQVRTDAGEPMQGKRVVFVASGSADAGGFEPDTAVTDSKGEALTRWVLGTAPGTYTGEARIVADADPVPTVTLTAAAHAGDPDTLRAVGPTVQPGRRGQPLSDPLVVVAVDRFGNPVEGAQVEWKTSNGGGDLSAETGATGADGTSSVTWTLGNRIGVQKATASVQGAKGSPVTFTATVLF